MKKLFPVFLVGGITAIGVALYRYYMKQIDFLKDIKYSVTGIKVIAITKENISLEITAQIYNASNVEAVIKEINLDVFVNGIKTGEVKEVKDMIVYPNNYSFFSFNFSFNPKVIGENILNILTLSVSLRDVVLNLKGDVKIQSSFVKANLPFEWSSNLSKFIKR
jgi:LEA14-like dessication related protein